MRIEVKCYILESRMNGIPIKEISKSVGMTFQGIHRFLSGLPFEHSGFVDKPNIDNATAKKIFLMYFNDTPISKISEATNVPKESIVTLFCFCLQRKRKTDYKLYPILSDWMTNNGYTVARLAERIGISNIKLSLILTGRVNMLFDICQKISQVTGLSISDIYSGLLPASDSHNEQGKDS